MKNIELFGVLLVAAIVAILIGACSADRPHSSLPNRENLVTEGDTQTDKSIGDAVTKYAVLGNAAYRDRLAAGTLFETMSPKGQTVLGSLPFVQLKEPLPPARLSPQSPLILGYPIALMDEHQVFGGVITKVSDRTNEMLGDLKLTDFPPLHVRPRLAKAMNGNFALVLFGCVEKCTEASLQVPLISLPVAAIDSSKTSLFIDVATLGEELNLIEMLDPDGEYTQLKTVSSKTVTLDYSLSTLVFDVEVRMGPKGATPSPGPDTVFTVRWYLRLSSTFNPAFETRAPQPEVGFFLTQRALNARINRFSAFRLGEVQTDAGPVQYFVKNVPPEFQGAFAAAFDEWNARFTEAVGYRLLNYTFVSSGDGAADLLTAGDVRYNILEWDLDNAASYGGLGPSIANQFSGEIFSANVLIQGPSILKTYKKWFKVAEQVRSLRLAGKNTEAETRLVELRRALPAVKERPHLELKLGTTLAFRIPSRLPSLEDPLHQRDDFEAIPTGFTFDTYMQGYFQEMVAHELGHNVGLRHNFRGNLAAQGESNVGKVSSSIMEYLGRPYRHLNRVGEYDMMAIRYGYAGAIPPRKGQYCTDEEVPRKKGDRGSAECSSEDATSDPFGYFETVLARVMDKLVAPSTPDAPSWSAEDLEREIKKAVTGPGLYALTAEKTAAAWTQFFQVPGRPSKAEDVPAYVLHQLRNQMCDPLLNSQIELKSTQAAKDAVVKNLSDLRRRAEETLRALGVLGAGAGVC